MAGHHRHRRVHPDAPRGILEFRSEWGSHEDEDLRAAIATCLLEHLLEHHFDTIFPPVEKAAKENQLFEDMFCGCRKFGQSEVQKNAERFDRLQKKCRLAR